MMSLYILLIGLACTMATERRLQNGNLTMACQNHDIEFIMIEGDENLKAIEEDIRTQLTVVGINVKSRMLSKELFNKAHEDGNFHLSFTETWGAPYDPHTYANGWVTGDEGHKQALTNLIPPATREGLFKMITAVLQEEDELSRAEQWKQILTTTHAQAVMLPMWGKRIPTVYNNERLTGYSEGLQQFDYPVHRLSVQSGSKTVTISPGAQTGAFMSVGRLDPHSYRPNEFFANNWVYEGLVAYGTQGQILPSLAESWIVTDSADGQTYSFSLRPNVTFHDGEPWNCSVATLNFDHALAKPLLLADYHGWYGLPDKIKRFIRPLRMLSPKAFAGLDPVISNSCPVNWGTLFTANNATSITCAGTINVSGTGPFKFFNRSISDLSTDEEMVDDEVVFVRNELYWSGVPSIEMLVVKRYDDENAVKAALLDKSLDIVWGAGVLSANAIREIEDMDSFLSVFHTGDVQNTMLLLNSGKAPLDDETIRKTIIHAVDKEAIIEKQLRGFESPVSNIFPLDAPYCDLYFTPRWDYDLEKAFLLNCNPEKSSTPEKNNQGSSNSALALGLGLGLGFLCVILLALAVVWYKRVQKAESELLLLRNKPDAVSA